MTSRNHGAADSAPGFSGLGLAEPLAQAVAALGYEEPTEVQRQAIPPLLAGRDLLAQAATGTGKTAAFALPILQRLLGGPSARHRPRALVLVPTRELAIQVSEAVHRYAQGSKLVVVPVYGGAPMDAQVRALSRGADVVVATPGRALDHLRRGTLDLQRLELLVLDEADEMLDMGFAEDLDALLSATPAGRQTALFSATMPARIESIARRHLREPERVEVAREKPAAGKLPRVRQLAYVVRRQQKPDVLGRVLDVEAPASALVFCRTRVEVDQLVEALGVRGHRALALHGGLQQRQRDAVMRRFRDAEAELLVATDVAARGLDIKHLSHVVNFDLPSSSEAYVHRIGRTGRAGREGTAITFVEPREHRLLRIIEQVTGQRVEVLPIPSVADLRARRLSAAREALRERLAAGGLEEERALVDELSAEHEPADVAAAAIRLLQAATSGGQEEQEIEAPPVPGERPARGRPGPPRGPRARGVAAARLWVGLGSQAGVRPGDLVGMIANEADIPSSELGAIDIRLRYALVEVPAARADAIVEALRGATLRGRKVSVRRERER